MGSAAADNYHVRFVPRDTHGHLNAAGTVTVGSYDDLDTAITIAAVSYGVGEAEWVPASEPRLTLGAFSGHSPSIEGRRISHPDEVGRVSVKREE